MAQKIREGGSTSGIQYRNPYVETRETDDDTEKNTNYDAMVIGGFVVLVYYIFGFDLGNPICRTSFAVLMNSSMNLVFSHYKSRISRFIGYLGDTLRIPQLSRMRKVISVALVSIFVLVTSELVLMHLLKYKYPNSWGDRNLTLMQMENQLLLYSNAFCAIVGKSSTVMRVFSMLFLMSTLLFLFFYIEQWYSLRVFENKTETINFNRIHVNKYSVPLEDSYKIKNLLMRCRKDTKTVEWMNSNFVEWMNEKFVIPATILLGGIQPWCKSIRIITDWQHYNSNEMSCDVINGIVYIPVGCLYTKKVPQLFEDLFYNAANLRYRSIARTSYAEALSFSLMAAVLFAINKLLDSFVDWLFGLFLGEYARRKPISKAPIYTMVKILAISLLVIPTLFGISRSVFSGLLFKSIGSQIQSFTDKNMKYCYREGYKSLLTVPMPVEQNIFGYTIGITPGQTKPV